MASWWRCRRFSTGWSRPARCLAYDEAGAARGNRHKITKTLSSYDGDTRAALDYLVSSPHCTGKLGVVGICIGGHLAFRAAMQPDVLAAACFYATDIHKRGLGQGTHDDSLDRIGKITGELLMIWGRQDPHIPREGRALIYNALSDAGAYFQWHEFNAVHAFMRDEGSRYDPSCGQDVLRHDVGVIPSSVGRRRNIASIPGRSDFSFHARSPIATSRQMGSGGRKGRSDLP